MDSYTQYFGYSKNVESISDMMLSDDGCVCLIKQITPDLYYELVSYPELKDASIGDWFISTGSCNSIKIHGVFTSTDDAFNYANEHLNVVSFRSPLGSLG